MPSNYQAAMVFGQLMRIKELLSIKRNIFEQYKKYLSILDVKFNIDNSKLKNGLWASVVVFDKKYKINIFTIKYLSKKRIFPREFFRPLSSQPAYKNFSSKK